MKSTAEMEELWRLADEAQTKRDEEERLKKKEYDKFRRKKISREQRRKYITKYKYNITIEDYDRMLEEQGGRCAIPTCRTDNPGDRYGRFHIDHDEHTGKVRRLLCVNCNMTIRNHSAEHLRALADYVEFWALKHYNTEE